MQWLIGCGRAICRAIIAITVVSLVGLVILMMLTTAGI